VVITNDKILTSSRMSAHAILKNAGGRFYRVAKLVYGLNGCFAEDDAVGDEAGVREEMRLPWV
jgi:hypothetical protein